MSLMRRQSLVEFDAPLCETIVDTPKPQGKRSPGPRSNAAALCHSDLHIQDGYADIGGGKRLDTTRGMTLPFTLGHEIAGVVEEVGPDARAEPDWPQEGGLSMDRLRKMPRLPEWRREPLRQATASWAFRSTAALPAMCWYPTRSTCSITTRCRSISPATLMCSGATAYAALKRLADRAAPAQPAAGRLGRRRDDGAGVRPGDVQTEDLRRRSRPAARETALKHGASFAFDPAKPTWSSAS